MIIRRTYTLENWRQWDAEINSFANEFYQHFGVWPNILLANSISLRRMDIAANANAQNIRSDLEEDAPAPENWVELSGFSSTYYSFDLCIDESVPQDKFVLIYDSDPEGEDSVPDEDTPVPAEQRKLRNSGVH